MRSRRLSIAAAILVVLTIAVAPPARCAKPPKDEFGTIEDAGVRVMAQAGIRRASDVESILIDSDFGSRITWKDNPQLVSGVYEGLRAMVRLSVMRGIGAGNLLQLNLKNGRTIDFRYQINYSDPAQGGISRPMHVVVRRNYYSVQLISPLQRIESNQAAALRDARIGEFPVASVEARIPGGQRVALKPCQPEAQALIAKGVAMVDWLDARTLWFEDAKPEEVDAVGHELGSIALSPVKPIVVKAPDRNAPLPPKASDAFEIRPRLVDFKCDRVVILFYKPGGRPRIALRDAKTGSYRVVLNYLRRRLQEQVGVEKYGWKGHPLTDTEYYKKPDVLYAEMEAIAKQAVEKYGKKTEQADPPR